MLMHDENEKTIQKIAEKETNKMLQQANVILQMKADTTPSIRVCQV